MATSATIIKLNSYVGQPLTAARLRTILANWTDEDFPKRLETHVRRWMKESGNLSKTYIPLIAEYAALDEQSAKWLVDPVPEAQDAILKLGDEDDLALLLKRCAKFTSISAKMWMKISRNADSLSTRQLKVLAAREDAPAKFVRLYGPKEKASSKVVKETPSRRGVTGKSSVVRSTRARQENSSDDDDYDMDTPDATAVKRPKSNKNPTVDKIRKAVKPARRIVSKYVEEGLDEEEAIATVRKVRRPRT